MAPNSRHRLPTVARPASVGHAFEVPETPGVRLHNLLTIFLDPSNGKGGIRNVVNGVGGSSPIANPDVPVTVVDFP